MKRNHSSSTTDQNKATDDKPPIATLISNLRRDDRGLQWTLEAVLAILVLFSALTFTIDALPASEQGSQDEFMQSQLTQSGRDVLSSSFATGDLADSLLYWDATVDSDEGPDEDGRFINSSKAGPSSEHYTVVQESYGFPLYPALNEVVTSENIAYNMIAFYETGGGGTNTQRVVYQGVPGEDAVIVTKTVTLYDSDVPAETYTSDDGDGCTLGELASDSNGCDQGSGSDYFAPDAEPGNARYNTIKIRLVLWRA
ncbi:DUF7288 family protein [Salinibaculum rarum]|uniref:DUF7288 family protein n=1 Tax=Salinibaculum rarum TaxID=3058903 RepID=UPI00265E50D6|nr:hypothetical protein [Salinibaculum sp. KK48]